MSLVDCFKECRKFYKSELFFTLDEEDNENLEIIFKIKDELYD